VPLGSRAIEILILLVERAGEVVPKRHLIDQVWPGRSVDDANLRVGVASLRKSIGDGCGGARYIINVPNRGYCFVSPVSPSEEWRSRPAATPP
jgi:DNA-binding winged helix-turn-helix (wHTH) protein